MWFRTPREILKVVKLRNENRVAEFDAQRAVIHEAAHLNAYAYHSPKKMPKFKPSKAARKPSELHPSQVEANAILFWQTMKTRAQRG